METLPDKKEEVPVELITEDSQVWRVKDRLKSEDASWFTKLGMLYGQYDGNKPYNEEDLKKRGEADRSNLNWRFMEGVVDDRQEDYHRIWARRRHLFRVELTVPHDENTRLWEEYIARALDCMIMQKWPMYFHETTQQFHYLSIVGAAHVWFPHKKSWQYECLVPGQLKVQRPCKGYIEDVKYATIEAPVQVQDLWAKVRSPGAKKAAKKAGWNVEQLVEVVANSVDLTDEYRKDTKSMEVAIADRLRDNAMLIEQCDDVDITHVFVKDYDGTVNHYQIVDAFETVGSLLYKKEAAFKEMGRIFQFQFARRGRGSFHGVKGLGTRAMNPIVVRTDLMNKMLDAANDQLTTWIQDEGGGDFMGDRHVRRKGRFRFIPENSKIDGTLLNANFSGAINVDSALASILTGHVQSEQLIQQQLARTRGAKSTTEVQQAYRASSKPIGADLRGYVDGHTKTCQEMFRRLTMNKLGEADPGYEQQQDFWEYIDRYGIPRDLVRPETCRITVIPPMGIDSDEDYRERLRFLYESVRPSMDAEGRELLDWVMVSDLLGPDHASMYKPPVNRDLIPNEHTSVIGLEINDMKLGMQVMVTSDQRHGVHLQWHMPDIERTLEQAGQMQDLQQLAQATRYLELAAEHVAKHLEYFMQDPQNRTDAEAYGKRVNAVVNAVQRLSNNVRQAMEAQAREQQRQQEEAVQNRINESNAKVVADFNLKLERLRGDLQLKAMDTEAKILDREKKTDAAIAEKQRKNRATEGG